jgi:tellurite methyltransferase
VEPTAAADDQDPRERWNRRYAERGLEPLAGEPSAWLVDNQDLIADVATAVGPGARRALDVACGDGRNAGHLARIEFDISDVAIAALTAAAPARDLPVRALRLDLETDPLPDGPYHVIVQFNYLQRSLFGALAARLAPGGLLLAETVTRAHIDQLGRAFDPRYVLEPGELRAAVAGLEVVRYEEGVVVRSGRDRAVASVVARRRLR